jgi:uncharacterized surface protein with fasciclin (FAS1) repeats
MRKRLDFHEASESLKMLLIFSLLFSLLAAEKVVDLLQSNSSYSVVSSLLNSSNLVNMLNQGNNYTVFAPDGTF